MRSSIRNKVISLLNEEYTPPKPNFIKKVRGLLLTLSNFDYDKAKAHKEGKKEKVSNNAAAEPVKDQMENSYFGNFSLDFYGIKQLDGYDEKCKCVYREGDGFYEKEKDGKPNPKEYEGDHIDFENREVMSISPSKLVISAGGDWQPMHYITIKMKDNGTLYVDECKRADDAAKMTDKRMSKKEVIEKLLSAPLD